ncbi:MAG: molybdenum cofactor guanylyltransferase [Chloroflexota bacterium]
MSCASVHFLRTVQVTSAILAGGRSSRLRRNKLFRRVAGKPLIEWVIGRVRPMSRQLVVVVSDPQTTPGVEESVHRLAQGGEIVPACDVRVVQDLVSGCGPLGGIYTALSVSSAPRCIVVGCDMPFLRQELLEYLVLALQGYDAVVPRVGHFIEPLCAVYHWRCLPHFAEALGQGEFQIRQALEGVRTRFVEESEIEMLDPHRYSFFNVNTRAELEAARRLAAGDQLLPALSGEGRKKW